MKIRLLGVLASVALAVSACSSGPAESDSGADKSTESAAETAEPAAETADPTPSEESGTDDGAAKETSEPAAGSSELTKPGTELKVGERAVLPYDDGVVAVTVSAVEKADKAAFVAKFGDRAKDIVPYFIKYEVEFVEGKDLAYSSGPRLDLQTADGGRTGAIVSGEMEGCERESAPKEFDSPGASFETCRLAGASPDVQITGAKFEDEEPYEDSPIVWAN
ncbi:MAG TPA: hypothetical protein VI076_15845 [Actinopolymorphaceae bacterium]